MFHAAAVGGAETARWGQTRPTMHCDRLRGRCYDLPGHCYRLGAWCMPWGGISGAWGRKSDAWVSTSRALGTVLVAGKGLPGRWKGVPSRQVRQRGAWMAGGRQGPCAGRRCAWAVRVWAVRTHGQHEGYGWRVAFTQYAGSIQWTFELGYSTNRNVSFPLLMRRDRKGFFPAGHSSSSPIARNCAMRLPSLADVK